MADPIRIGNFFSTFDTESVIAQLTIARQGPIRQLDVQVSKLTRQKAAIADLTTRFSNLLLKAKALAEATSVSARTATVDGKGISAAAGPGAALGAFTVGVTQVATATSMTGSAISAALDSVSILNSSNFANPVTAGTFKIATATGGTATITVNPATQSLNDVIGLINASGVGVTATIQNDANGRANILQLTSTQGAITLGSGADTANFLVATNVSASPGTTTRQSTVGIARVSQTAKLSTASLFGGAPAAGDHTISINGVSISYNAANDSLSDVITRINASTAGVTARYDSLTDTVKLQQIKTGSTPMVLADDGGGGNLLSKLGLAGATQTLGQTAQYSVDGGATQYADSNSVTINGASVTFTALTDPLAATKVTVSADTAAAVAAATQFVATFNAMRESVDAATRTDGKDSSKRGALAGDSSVTGLQTSLRMLAAGAGVNIAGAFSTLGQVGISFGAVGSALGSTNNLQLDETKFKAALVSDPVSVQAVFSQYKLGSTLVPGGTGSIASMTGTYTGAKAGSYVITDDGAGNLSSLFTPQDGSTPVTTTAIVTASGTNTTLVPGMTLQIGGALTAGTNTITVAPTSSSVMNRLKDFLEGQVGVSGSFTQRAAIYDRRTKDIAARQVQIQAGIDAEMSVLRSKFARMEQAQARAQTAMSQIQSAITNIGNSNK